MESSIFFAKLIGPYCIIVALGILLNRKTYQRVMEDFFKNSALIYLGGIFALFFGLIVVLFHNVWVAGWPVIITIFGWLGLLKGAWLIIFPRAVAKLTKVYQKNSTLLVVHSMIVFAIGVVLTFFGSFA